jgi:inner membrane protein
MSETGIAADTPSAPRPAAAPRSFGLKLLLVCALAVMMAIPAGFVWMLVYARSSDANRAVIEVSQMRGGQQTLMGPAIVVPFERDVMAVVNNVNTVQTVNGRLVLYPETGAVNARLEAETLKRGLHDIPVYQADAAFTGRFEPARLAAEAPANARIRWAEARVFMTLTDLHGAKEASLTLGGRLLELAPAEAVATETYGPPVSYQRLIGAPIPWLQDAMAAPLDLEARLSVSGAQRIAFAAFAKDTTISLAGDWPSPSFDGGALPDARTVTDAGFTASWRIPYLARGAAGAGVDLSFDTLTADGPGATLLDQANPYQSVERSLKYAPMFLGLVFLTYFLFEATSGAKAHPAQYVLVGLAQLVFYMLLLSVSEQLGFTPGFLIAATATVLAISLYAGSVFDSRAAALKALVVFSALYALIYILMRMEDYALLVGSIASFLAIAATMWMTRKLDWYGVGRTWVLPIRD